MEAFMNRFALWCSTLVVLIPCLFTACDAKHAAQIAESLESAANNARTTSAPGARDGSVSVRKNGETITVASFNIQVFGQSKLQKPEVMDTLASVARRFDVLAIQEVRSKEPTVLPEFIARINADGSQYSYVIGPRQGRTVSKEQYAVVYDASRIELVGTPYIVPDPQDLLHREPMVTSFRVRSSQNPFTFKLINIHTDPDETDQEVNALADVWNYVQQDTPVEDDVILLGDLNVNERKLGRLAAANMQWTVHGEPTNTRGTASYDNILFDRYRTTEFTGRSGVFDLMSEYGLSETKAIAVSDHLPVWAEFTLQESGAGPIASRPGSVR